MSVINNNNPRYPSDMVITFEDDFVEVQKEEEENTQNNTVFGEEPPKNQESPQIEKEKMLQENAKLKQITEKQKKELLDRDKKLREQDDKIKQLEKKIDILMGAITPQEKKEACQQNPLQNALVNKINNPLINSKNTESPEDPTTYNLRLQQSFVKHTPQPNEDKKHDLLKGCAIGLCTTAFIFAVYKKTTSSNS